MDINSKIKDILSTLPDKPGCYIMRNRSGNIIYVGKASSLKKRVSYYFRPHTLRTADSKLLSLIHSIDSIDFILTKNEAEAILTEGELIKQFKPRYNIYFRDDKRFLMLKVNPHEPFPRFHLCRINKDNSSIYFGPYPSSKVAKAALDFVEKRFGLRRCNSVIPDQDTHKHCINDIVRYCSAPCIGKISQEEYYKRFQEACDFLKGEKPEILKELRENMEKAAYNLEFEKAALLRDLLDILWDVVKQRHNLTIKKNIFYKNYDVDSIINDMQKKLNLSKAPRLIEAFDISTICGNYAVASKITFMDGRPFRSRYRRFRIKTIKKQDDPAMLKEVIKRWLIRVKNNEYPEPDLILVDGGSAQANSAKQIIDEMELNIPVIALTKRLEEIYFPYSSIPLRLPYNSPMLNFLKAIRDEAHRFALNYHKKLRAKQIKQSILDEIEGLGEKKRNILLTHFKSIDKIAQASVEEIVKIKGFGLKTAEKIKKFFEDKAWKKQK